MRVRRWLIAQKSKNIYLNYVKKGKDLYHCYYTERDHIELASLLDSLHHGTPGADILVTYDYTQWLSQLYQYPDIRKIGRFYSA